MTNPKCIIEMNKETAGVSSFLNQEFLLQLTFEFDKSNNLKLGIYINEKLYNDQVFTVAGCDMSKFGSYIGLYREKMNSVITVASYPEQVVEKPNENLTKVSFSDLGVRNKVYDAVGGDLAVKGDYGQTLAGTIVGGDIQLDGTGLFQIVFGGKTNGWDGLRMMATDSYIHTYWYAGSEGTFIKTLVPNVAGVDFVGEKYKLEVSLEVVGNDIKVGYWFNGILYENAYETIPNRAEELGGLFGVYCAEADDKVTIGTPSDEDDDQEEDVTPEKPNSNWSKYTWKDFEIKEKTYKFNGDLIASGKLTAKDTLASSIFGGDIQLNGGDGFQVIAGGKDLGWDGLRLIANSGRFDVYWYKGNTGTFVESLYSDKAGVSFLNEKYNLKISMEVVGKNLKVGIWFNDVLYNNKYFEILNKAEQLGNRFGVYAPAAENTVVIGNPVPGEDDDTPKQPNPKFEKLTFGHFAVKDMTYPYNGDMVVQGSVDDRTTLDKTVICGDVLLSGKGSFQLIFGGNGNAWDGLRLIADEKAMHVYWYKGSEGTYVKSLMPLAAGTEFVGQEMNLMVSMEKSGKDVKVGIWINGVLYENEYIIFKGKAKELGNMFAAYCSDPSATITLNSIAEIAPEPEKPKKPNKDFKKLTFSHFEVKDGKHKCDGTVAATLQGKTEYSLDGAILCGDIRIEGVGNTYLMYGGLNNVWYGFRFSVLSNGNIALYWIDEDGMYLIETFDATTAGTKLVDEWFNVMISTEVVDADDDGEEDDIEFGIWFNEVLYKNKYLTVLNEAKDFGKWFGIDCATEGTAVSTKSIPELIEGFNYALYGFTENWEEEILRTGFKAGMAVGGSKDAAAFTGDLLENGKVFFWVFGAVSALVAGIYLALQGKKKKI